MVLATVLEEAYEPIAPQLKAVRATVRNHWTDALQLVHGPDVITPETMGKMLRPALCLLSAGALGAEDLDAFVELAASFELLHLAALTHDDVVDSADLRRGTTSLNALWDDHAAVLGGDYLVARAILLLTRHNSCALVEDVVDAVRQMAEGELCHLGRKSEEFRYEDCIRLAEQKTACLFAATCAGPTYLLEDTHREALRAFGLGLGVAFQLVDDILDLSQSEAALGKPVCGDIAESKVTLPILFMGEALTGDDQRRFKAMAGTALTDEDRSWVGAVLESTGARKQTEDVAQRHIDDARTALHQLPQSRCRDAMAQLLEFILVRGS